MDFVGTKAFGHAAHLLLILQFIIQDFGLNVGKMPLPYFLPSTLPETRFINKQDNSKMMSCYSYYDWRNCL